jgi:hypothetical protein
MELGGLRGRPLSERSDRIYHRRTNVEWCWMLRTIARLASLACDDDTRGCCALQMVCVCGVVLRGLEFAVWVADWQWSCCET